MDETIESRNVDDRFPSERDDRSDLRFGFSAPLADRKIAPDPGMGLGAAAIMCS